MTPTILIVEDEPAIQELLAVNLKHNGFLVVRAGSAEEGESAIRAALPDLLILDWMLPGQSGVALAKKLRGILCHVNLIPLNPVPERGLNGVSRAEAEQFSARLAERNISATVRREMGTDIEGACGQLRRRILHEIRGEN